MEITVSQLIVRYLERLGIGTLFGMPGAHILPVYDRLYDSSIRTVLVKHEQGAAFMAGGYARASGRIGACITTAGPGATNLVTGIANAYADRLPVLVITGETSTHIFGKGGLQESSGEGGAIDQAALFRGVTRYHKLVERTDYLPQVLNKATKILRSPNPGPVLLSFPFNVQQERVDAGLLEAVGIKPPPGRPRPPAVGELATLIRKARAPAIIAGSGCLRSGAQEVLGQLCHRFNIPLATSLKAKGVIDESSPLALGTLGVTSQGRAYRYLVEQADLLLFLGAGFNERTSYLWDAQLLAGKRIAQIDHDPEQLERVFHADVALHGDIRPALEALLKGLEEQGMAPKGVPVLEADPPPSWQGAPGIGGTPADFALIRRFFDRLAATFPTGAMIFDDNILFAQNFLAVSAANRYFPNSGVSSLGHAIPAAIGARFAEEGPTFAILGDGGFQMCGFELMTAVNYGIPLNVVVLNNGGMGLIRKNQVQLYGSRLIDCDFVNPDFARLAEAFGIRHCRVAGEEDLDRLFRDHDLERGINLIEIPIDRDAFPNYLSRR
jgi:acetolactate synthase I/II/III large subunit